MNMLLLTVRNIVGSPFRSGLIFLCVILVAVSSVWATLFVQDAQTHIQDSITSIDGFEADILVVPRESTFANDQAAAVILDELTNQVRAVPGVAEVSSRIHSMESPEEAGIVDAVLLVKISPGRDPHTIATLILSDLPGVTVFDRTNFFQRERSQMVSLMGDLPILIGMIWAFSVVCIGLVFTVGVNERRREIGVLRVLGSSRTFVLWSILVEGYVLALGGGLAGSILSLVGGIFFGSFISQALGLHQTSLSIQALWIPIIVSLGLALVSVTLAAIFPAWRISRLDPELALKR